jgi:prepilin-type N-terminal cleavage/methylation domain-containing protein
MKYKKTLKFELNNGFTLVELAIVLIIMSLLVFGSLAGVSLIDAANTRATITEVNKIAIAQNNFVEQYGGLPGDINNANKFWPSATPAIANGDANGKIYIGNNLFAESFGYWHQLILAKLISLEMSSPGDNNGDNTSVVGNNAPRSKNFSGGFSIRWVDNAWNYSDDLGRKFSANFLYLGQNSSQFELNGSVFTPEKAFIIDKKIDDGVADSGKMLADSGVGSVESCTLGSGTQINYDLAQNNISCIVIINLSDGKQ